MRIFLSYASPDLTAAEGIANALSSEHHSLFFDRKSLRGGDSFVSLITKELRRSEVFLFLVSSHSIRQESFAMLELQLAIQQSKQHRIRIVPVLLEPLSQISLPIEIAHLSAIAFSVHAPTAVIAHISSFEGRARQYARAALVLILVAVPAGLLSFLMSLLVIPLSMIASLAGVSYILDEQPFQIIFAALILTAATAATSIIFHLIYNLLAPMSADRSLGSIAVFLGTSTGLALFVALDGGWHYDNWPYVVLCGAVSGATQLLMHALFWRRNVEA